MYFFTEIIEIYIWGFKEIMLGMVQITDLDECFTTNTHECMILLWVLGTYTSTY